MSEVDFLTIAPAKRAEVRLGRTGYGFHLVSGKRYRVTLHYKNDPTNPNIEPSGYRGSGLWSDTPGLVEKIKTTQGCDLSSNPIEITVE